MKESDIQLIDLLQTRVRQLLLQHKELQQKHAAALQALRERESDIQALEELNREMQQQYANLKLAKTLELSDSDTRSAKRRLGKLVREVDECIALLKA